MKSSGYSTRTNTLIKFIQEVAEKDRDNMGVIIFVETREFAGTLAELLNSIPSFKVFLNNFCFIFILIYYLFMFCFI